MCKKLVTVVLIGLIGAYVVSETKAGSHFRAWVSRLGKKLEKEVTPEQELARIRHEIEEMEKDVDRVKGDLAEAKVNVQLLHEETESLRADFRESDALVRRHGEVLKKASPQDMVQWGHRQVNFDEAREILQSEVKQVRALRDRLKAREIALGNAEKTRDVIETELQEMLKQRDELSTAVDELENEIKLAKIEQMRSKHQNDGSRMAGIKKSMTELKKRVLIQRERTKLDARVSRPGTDNRSVEEILADLDNTTRNMKSADDVRIVSEKE